MTLFFHVFVAAAIAGALVLAVPPLGHWWQHHHHRPATRARFRTPTQGGTEQPALLGAMLAMMVAAWFLLTMR